MKYNKANEKELETITIDNKTYIVHVTTTLEQLQASGSKLGDEFVKHGIVAQVFVTLPKGKSGYMINQYSNGTQSRPHRLF